MFRVDGMGLRAAACAAVAVLSLAACGGQDADSADDPPETSSSAESPSGDPAPPGTPDCTEVWQEGETIPRGYQGCADETGAFVERDVLGCSSGQRMVRYGDRFWGVLGGTVNEADGSLDDDRDYKASMRNCSA